MVWPNFDDGVGWHGEEVVVVVGGVRNEPKINRING
jgi:hypothetical protein